MKTAISLPDSLFEAAEREARRLGVSRSEFYGRALSAWLKEHGSDGITEKLNEIYSDTDSSLDEAVARLQELSVPDEAW